MVSPPLSCDLQERCCALCGSKSPFFANVQIHGPCSFPVDSLTSFKTLHEQDSPKTHRQTPHNLLMSSSFLNYLYRPIFPSQRVLTSNREGLFVPIFSSAEIIFCANTIVKDMFMWVNLMSILNSPYFTTHNL